MSRVLLCGAFGQGNAGDEALLQAFLQSIPDHDVLVTSAGPVPDGVVAVAPRAATVARAARHVDAVVVGGGTVFKTLHPASSRRPGSLLARTALLHAAAHARGIPMLMIGVGAGELRGRRNRRLAAMLASRADLLVLRDEESAAVLAAAGVRGPFRIGADPAWTLLTPSGADGLWRGPRTSGPVVIALSHLADRDQSRLTDRLTTVVDRISERGHDAVLQPWQHGTGHDDDQRLAEAVRRARPSTTIAEPPRSLVAAAAAAAGYRAVVTLRFHGLVAAAAAGVPTLTFAHEPKLAGLARRLQQPAVPPHASAAVLAHAVDDLLTARTPDRAAVVDEIAAAGTTMRLLHLFLDPTPHMDSIDHATLDLSQGVPW